VISKVVFWGQMTLIALKADYVIPNWLYVFYPVLFILFFFVAASIGHLLIFIWYFVQHYGTASFRVNILGRLWELAYSFFSWPAALSVLGIIFISTNEKDITLQITVLMGLVHASAFIFYTFIAKKSILKYVIGPILAEEREKLDKARKNKEFETVKEKIPYLIKISPTYFVEMSSGFNLKNKQQVEDWKRQIQDVRIHGKPIKRDSQRMDTEISFAPIADKGNYHSNKPKSADKSSRERNNVEIKKR